MSISDFFKTELFTIGSHQIIVEQIALLLVLLVSLFWVYRIIFRRVLPAYYARVEIDEKQKKRTERLIKYIIYLIGLLGGMLIFRLDYALYPDTPFKVSLILQALLIFQIARLIDWLISKVMLHNYYISRDKEKEKTQKHATPNKSTEAHASSTSQYIVYIICALWIISIFNLDHSWQVSSSEDHTFNLKFSKILIAVLILLAARLFAWVLTQLVLYSYYKRNKVNIGSQYAINQLLRYVIYGFAAFLAIENLGIQMTLIWGGAAALLVGVGLGLQQTFNDLISGIILLFERTVEVGDVVDINGLVGSVKKIGLRISLVETFAGITVIVPNSKLIVENVVNWSHYDDKARFHVSVGVAYGSDTALVKKLLMQVARENIYILNYPMPLVRFVNFNDSSLDFELHFWTRNFLVIEDVKSDVRFGIDRLFRENDISIPFPQRDIWIKK